jgi:hypothetical protein
VSRAATATPRSLKPVGAAALSGDLCSQLLMQAARSARPSRRDRVRATRSTRAPGLQPGPGTSDTCPVDDVQDPEAWADAFLDQYRTTPRRDLDRDEEAAVRALADLPPITRWALTRGGSVPDLDTIERIQRNSRRHAIFQKWETIFTLIGVALLCLFALVWSSAF